MLMKSPSRIRRNTATNAVLARYAREADGLGSVTSVSSSAGVVANTYTYDSFGNVTNFTGTLRNPFQYTGREFDLETGIYEYRARES